MDDNFREISVEEAKKLDRKKYVFIDVRTLEEWEEEHLDNTLHINIACDDFLEKIQELDKTKHYVIFCHSGHRSQRAMELMKDLGFKMVWSIRGLLFGR
ncbi:rhodanese-like domain-containing protein [Candidatus Woesearchaeota archaeon]|nr:rhodanese-like domain-containing protein [Candidatus Woesearchaeota archaeon]